MNFRLLENLEISSSQQKPKNLDSQFLRGWFPLHSGWDPVPTIRTLPIKLSSPKIVNFKSLKSATRLLNRVCVERQGLDLSKEVLWVSVCQRAAKLPAGKVGGLKKNSAMRPGAGESVSNPAAWQNLFSNLQLCQLVAQLPFDIQRPKVPL